MGHNVSPRKAHAPILASPAAEWRDCQLAIDCGTPTCTRGRRYLMADLARIWPEEKVSGLLRRMTCQVCGGGVMEARLIRERPMRPREAEDHPCAWARRAPARGVVRRCHGPGLRARGMPLRPLVGEDYKRVAAEVDAQLRALWQRRPWRG